MVAVMRKKYFNNQHIKMSREEADNFFKLTTVITSEGATILRGYVRNHITRKECSTFQQFLQKFFHVLFFLVNWPEGTKCSCGMKPQSDGKSSRPHQFTLTRSQWNKLYQADNGKHSKCRYIPSNTVLVDHLDVSLCTCLLKQICADELSSEEITSIDVIRNNRNTLFHSESPFLNKDEFNRMWTDIHHAVMTLVRSHCPDDSQQYFQRLNEIKNMFVDEAECKRFIEDSRCVEIAEVLSLLYEIKDSIQNKPPGLRLYIRNVDAQRSSGEVATAEERESMNRDICIAFQRAIQVAMQTFEEAISAPDSTVDTNVQWQIANENLKNSLQLIERFKDINCILEGAKYSSIELTIRTPSERDLENFIIKYQSGALEKMIQETLITDNYLLLTSMKYVKLNVYMTKSSYEACGGQLRSAVTKPTFHTTQTPQIPDERKKGMHVEKTGLDMSKIPSAFKTGLKTVHKELKNQFKGSTSDEIPQKQEKLQKELESDEGVVESDEEEELKDYDNPDVTSVERYEQWQLTSQRSKMEKLTNPPKQSGVQHKSQTVADVSQMKRHATRNVKPFHTLSVEEVVECFKECSLEKLATRCSAERIDGAFIADIPTADIKGLFGLSELQAKKVGMTKEGWRPGKDSY